MQANPKNSQYRHSDRSETREVEGAASADGYPTSEVFLDRRVGG
jgi:hypothetical protein